MLRFFLGLAFGVVLTVFSFGFVGVGHGTFAPMAFTASLIALIPAGGAIPAILLSPFLWALYFQLIPKIQKRSIRITTTAALLSCHILSGTWLAIEDAAFTRALRDEPRGLVIFGLILALAMTCLFYFAMRGVRDADS